MVIEQTKEITNTRRSLEKELDNRSSPVIENQNIECQEVEIFHISHAKKLSDLIRGGKENMP